jgi:hypothetical protein
MTPASFLAWRIRMYGPRGVKAAAEALGCSRTSIIVWERGYAKNDAKHIEAGYSKTVPREIPTYIALACQALANGLPPMT